MARKAQGLPLNTIIISIIVIVVLVIVILIFTGNMGPWVQNTRSCSVQGGECIPGACDGTVVNAVCRDSSGQVSGDTCCVRALG